MLKKWIFLSILLSIGLLPSWVMASNTTNYPRLNPQASLKITFPSSNMNTKRLCLYKNHTTACNSITVPHSPMTVNLTITNTSAIIAYNIKAALPAAWTGVVTQTPTTGCPQILPGQSCALSFSYTGTAPASGTSIAIKGSNTNTTLIIFNFPTSLADLTVTPALITVPIFPETASLIITNNSAITAYNINATLPPAWANIVTQNPSTGCTQILPNQSCTLSFYYTGTPPTSETLVPITGDNTNTTLIVFNFTTPPADLTVTPAVITVPLSPSTALLTITNNSAITTANNVKAALPISWTNVTQTPTTGCLQILPGQSCDLSFSYTGTAPASGTLVAVNGSNTNSTDIVFDFQTPSQLIIAPTSLALKISGSPRLLTITNSGSPTIITSVTPTGLASGTTITDGCTNQTLNNQGQCSIQINPGSSATSNCNTSPGSVPTPGTVVVNTNSSSAQANVVILGYGCIYQTGYVFAMNDNVPITNSITGKIAETFNRSYGIVWDNICAGTGSCQLISTNQIDGNTNTQHIISALQTPYKNYAAGLCYTNQGWYLPSICELGGQDKNNPSVCTTTIDNMLNNLYYNNIGGPNNLLIGNFWSSTQGGSSNLANIQFYPGSMSQNPSQVPQYEGYSFLVRCVSTF